MYSYIRAILEFLSLKKFSLINGVAELYHKSILSNLQVMVPGVCKWSSIKKKLFTQSPASLAIVTC